MARAKRRHPHHNANTSHHEGEMEEGTQEAMDRAARQAHRMQRTALDSFDMLNVPMTRLMDQNWSMFQKTLQVMQAESLSFMNRRLEHTSHAIENSRDCEGISGLLAIQQEWMVDFARDYAEQTRRLTELMRDLAENGASNVSSATSEMADHGRDEAEDEHRRAAA